MQKFLHKCRSIFHRIKHVLEKLKIAIRDLRRKCFLSVWSKELYHGSAWNKQHIFEHYWNERCKEKQLEIAATKRIDSSVFCDFHLFILSEYIDSLSTRLDVLFSTTDVKNITEFFEITLGKINFGVLAIFQVDVRFVLLNVCVCYYCVLVT